MKKILLYGSLIIVAVVVLGAAGLAFAQDGTPPSPGAPAESGAWGGRGGRMMQGGGYMWNSGAGFLHDYMFQAMAEIFGLSPEELQARHDAGETMWDLAAEQGIDAQEFYAKMVEARSQAIEQALADGVISQEQADWMLSRMEQMGQYGDGYGACQGGAGGMRGGRGGRWQNQPSAPSGPGL